MKLEDLNLARTKIAGLKKRFDLNDPVSRKAYFTAKVGKEIKILQKYLKSGERFVAFLIGKKNSGKGTYSKLFMEAVGTNVAHISIGDIIRDVHKSIETAKGKKELVDFLKKNYRGFHDTDETIAAILGRSQSALITSELVLALITLEISKRSNQSIFIDGFPRAFDQIPYSLFLKEIIGYHGVPDMFVFIDVPTNVIDERIKSRVICPVCKTPRGLKLLTTKEVGFDKLKKEFYLKCDNPTCKGQRMVPKEGDELGIGPIKERLEIDDKISQQLRKTHGVDKVFVRNSIPVKFASRVVDQYEITPEYRYVLEKSGKVKTLEVPWTVKDDSGVPSYSLLPSAVVISLIKQMANILK